MRVILLVLSVPVASVIRGWVLSILWGWFAVPLGVPPIGVVHMMGLSILFSLLLHANADDKDFATVKETARALAVAVGVPLIMLPICALLKWGMTCS